MVLVHCNGLFFQPNENINLNFYNSPFANNNVDFCETYYVLMCNSLLGNYYGILIYFRIFKLALYCGSRCGVYYWEGVSVAYILYGS